MRMRWVVVMIGLAMAACSSNEPAAPTCEQAFGGFYARGCTWGDAEPLDVAVCRAVAQQYPAACRDELDAWLRCIDEAAAGRCDCEAEQNALNRCGG
jgi:hypothetical protein